MMTLYRNATALLMQYEAIFDQKKALIRTGYIKNGQKKATPKVSVFDIACYSLLYFATPISYSLFNNLLLQTVSNYCNLCQTKW